MELIAALIIAGGLLLFLEALLPGFVAGTAGTCLLLLAVGLSYHRLELGEANLVALGILLGGILMAFFWVRFFPKSRLARPFISHGKVGEIGTARPGLVSQRGVALTPLRPSGMALINGARVDVITEGDLIEAQSPVQVVAVEGIRVVVKRLS